MRVKAAVAPLLLATALALAPAAQADPVQEFNIQLKNVQADGRYTIVFSSNSYDTSGEQPPQVTANSVRFAAGVTIRPEFLTSRYRCDVGKLRQALVDTPEPTRPTSKRLAKLADTYKRIRERLGPAGRRAVEACVRSEIGQGVVVADTRPFIADPIPAKLTLYLAKPSAPGAVASFGVLAVIDESTQVYRDIGLLQMLGPLSFNTDVFSEPSAEGVYGYRLALPAGPVGIVKISLAELRVSMPGLTQVTKKVTCVRRARGSCKKKTTVSEKLFWLTPPTCPAAGKLGFESTYTYETGVTLSKALQLPCPRFKR